MIIGTFDSTKILQNNSLTTDFISDGNINYNTDFEKFSIDNSVIYFSGEVFNKTELEDLYCLKSETIPELILKLYINNDFNSFKKINGEYTFVIITKFDTIICRDRNGCSLPIYYTEKYFSDSFITLLNYSGIKKDVNIEAIASFLGLGYIPSPYTPLKFVKKLGAGNFLLYKHGVNIIESNLFDFEDFAKSNKKEPDLINFKDKYIDLIDKSLNSIINSSENKAYIDFNNYFENLINNKNIENKTELYNRNNSIKHHEINNLPQIIRCLEIPFNDFNLIHNYLFFKKIKHENYSILINFNGLDQLLGSNSNNIFKYLKALKNRSLKLIRLIKNILNFKIFENNKRIYLVKRLLNRILNIYSIGRNGFSKKHINSLLKADFQAKSYKYQSSLPINVKNFEDAYLSHNYFIDIKQSINEIEVFQMKAFARKFEIKTYYPLLNNNIYNLFKEINPTTKNNEIKEILLKIRNERNLKKNYSFYLHINQANYLYDANLRKKLFKYIQDSDACINLFNKKNIDLFFSNLEKEIISKTQTYKVLYDLSFQFFNILILTLWWDIIINNKKGDLLQDFY